LRAWTG